MREKDEHGTASIYPNKHCSDCGWPIIFACCNDEFCDYVEQKNTGVWDWWFYCSNKGCKNHEGQGVFQDLPEWVEINSEK